MSTDTRDKLNAGETDYHQKFDQNAINDRFKEMTERPDMKALDDQGNAFARDYDPKNTDDSRRSLASGERDSGKTPASANHPQSNEREPSSMADRLGNNITRVVGKARSPKAIGIGAGAILIISFLVSIGFLAPSSLLMHLNENGKSWMSKYTNLGVNNRLRQQLATRFFEDPGSCTGIKAVKRYCGGMTEAELTRLRENKNISIDDSKVHRLKDGTLWLDELKFKDGDVTTTVNSKNFASMHAKNVGFQAAMNSMADAQGLSFRAKNILKKFSSFGVNRSTPLGDATDEKSILKYFREKFYGEKGSLDLKPSSDGSETPDTLTKLEGFDDLNEQADLLRSGDVIENGPTAIVPDMASFDSPEITAKSVVSIGYETAKGGAKGTLLGVFATVDSACAVYNTIRILNYGVKALMAYKLIQFAMTYSTIADKQKATQTAMAEVSFLASSLLRKSTMPASLGKDFSQSQGANLIFYGKITNPKDLNRFSIGNTASAALGAVFSVFNFGDLSPEVCKRVSSWWGQLFMLIGGIIISSITLGQTAFLGAAAGIAKGLAYGMVQQVLTPRLIPLIAGTVIPDIRKDPEGGYGIGNAIASGYGAFGAQTGRAKGFRALTKTQYATLNKSEDATMLAKVKSYENSQQDHWSLDNANSIPNTLALQLMDLTNQKSSLSEYVAAMSSVTTKNIAKISQNAGAISADQERGGQFCGDDETRAAMKTSFDSDLAQDANCNFIYGPSPELIANSDPNDPNNKYSPKRVSQYMYDNGHIDEEGIPKSDQFKQYVDTCVLGTEPLVDKYGADLQEGIDMTPCYEKNDTEEVYNYFAAQVADDDIHGGIQSAAEGSLGYASADTGGNYEGTDNPGNLVDGDPQTLAQQILASGKVTGDSRYMAQIQAYANGDFTCHINPTILSLIVTLAQKFSLYITSLNRFCTGVLTGSGTGSYHYRDGGGHAVDIGIVDGVTATGNSPKDIEMLKYIVPLLPSGSGIGQAGCRPSGALTLPSGVVQFPDSCNHDHMQVPIK